MATHDLVKIFDSSKIRVVWDERFLQLQDPERSIEQVSKNRMYSNVCAIFFCPSVWWIH